MDAYTLELLERALEVSLDTDDVYEFTIGPLVAGRHQARALVRGPRPYVGEGPTLADALADLLRDLGAEVPEPPSAERAKQLASWSSATSWRVLREHYLRGGADRLAVLALLEGGES